MKTYVFPGQGSQQKGMGKELFDKYRDLIEISDEILGYSIEELCLEDPEDKLNFTQYTQPALYIVSALSYYEEREQTGTIPDYVAGHSLGEYNALLAAGVFDFATGLKIVKKRGELMANAPEGGMAAVLGLSREALEKVISDNNLNSIDVANFNTPSQIVISGPKKDIAEAEKYFIDGGATRYVALNVSGAFHSRYMAGAAKEFDLFLQNFVLKQPKIPVIANYTAREYRGSDIKSYLVQQMKSSVKWTETVCYLMGKDEEMEFKQMGPGRVLVSMIRNIKREGKPIYEEEVREEVGEEIEAKVKQEVINTQTKQENVDIKTERGNFDIVGQQLGSKSFKERYGLKYAYLTGSMYRGIASPRMIEKIANIGCLGFLGTGGMSLEEIEKNFRAIKEVCKDNIFGMNLLHLMNNPTLEEKIVDFYLDNNVKVVEASGYMNVTYALAKLRVKSLYRDENNKVCSKIKIIGKISRPEVAEAFMSPVPERIMKKLISDGAVSDYQVKMAEEMSVVDDICAEADSGGHSNHGVAIVVLTAIQELRNRMMEKFKYQHYIHVGLAGGIGTPEAIMAAFAMRADFVMTGSINQCTVEAGTSDAVKDILQTINVQDTEYVPAGDMFEIGAKVQVVKKGVFFPARANKLYDIYTHYNSLREIEPAVAEQIQERYFKASFEEIYERSLREHKSINRERAERDEKYKMSIIFRQYFALTNKYAVEGKKENKVDFQIHCGPALGAFNQMVKGTNLEDWKNRYVDKIAVMLMEEAAKRFKEYINAF
ncbi:ACP S-malonyltransferase [Cellulosilyticum ruminicola]|uniref:ACP S-malonyltransferase n=1 Tax=Cellulosilyticum ruminicola TaxID=425254 RepID=UPI0006D2C0F6|nr:ACP S-malonyltransferase [Cellulosilyticum ruminicola]